MKELTTLFIGDAQSTEFSVAVKILAEQTRVNHFNDSSIAQQFLITDHITPDLIVLAQSYPGQYNAKEVQELRTRAPLTRIIVLLGTWCEGESRSGSPIGGTIRIYWHQFASQGGQELEQLRSGRCSTWGLDATATDDERLLLASSQGQRTLRQPGPGLVAIVTANRELALCLIDACRLQGIASTWYLP